MRNYEKTPAWKLADAPPGNLRNQTKRAFACLHGLIKVVVKEAGVPRKIGAAVSSLLVVGLAHLTVRGIF